MQRWNQNFDHEAPARLQMRGNVLEARDLAALGGQVHDRVAHQVASLNVPSTRVVATSPMVTPTPSASGLVRSCATISGDRSIPCTRTPPG